MPSTIAGGRIRDLETVALARGLQGLEVAGTIAPETEVVADHQVTRAQAIHQVLADEVLRRERRHVRVEAHAEQPVHALRRERLELLAKARQARRCGRPHEVLARRGLEAHHHGRQSARPRRRDEPAEHRTVPQVQPVEVADGDGRAPVLRTQVVFAADKFQVDFRYRRGKPAQRHRIIRNATAAARRARCAGGAAGGRPAAARRDRRRSQGK